MLDPLRMSERELVQHCQLDVTMRAKMRCHE